MLITYANFREEFAISENIEDARLKASIEEAQNFDIKKVIGDAFFYDVDTKYNTSPADADIVKLVDGGTYLDCQGNTVYFDGLAKAVKYYALARYRKKQPINDTAFGVVFKNDNYSTPLDYKTLNASIEDARASGLGYLNDVLKFLNESKDIYPLYKLNSDNKRKPLRITAVDNLPKYTNRRITRYKID